MNLLNLTLILNTINDSIGITYYILLYIYLNLYNFIYNIIIFSTYLYFYCLFFRNQDQYSLIKNTFIKFISINTITVVASLISFLFHNHFGLSTDEYEEFFILTGAYIVFNSIIFYFEYFYLFKKQYVEYQYVDNLSINA